MIIAVTHNLAQSFPGLRKELSFFILHLLGFLSFIFASSQKFLLKKNLLICPSNNLLIDSFLMAVTSWRMWARPDEEIIFAWWRPKCYLNVWPNWTWTQLSDTLFLPNTIHTSENVMFWTHLNSLRGGTFKTTFKLTFSFFQGNAPEETAGRTPPGVNMRFCN